MDVYYFDTCIWLDHYEKRGASGESALRLIHRIIDEDSLVLYSDLHLQELKNLGYSQDAINTIFRMLKPSNLRRVHIDVSQKLQAREIARSQKYP